MANLSEDIQCAGSDTRPPMLDRTDFASWQQRPFQMGTFWETHAEGNEGALHLGLPKDIYILINHYTDAKDIWDNVKMLLEGSELIKDDRESQLYDDFEHFRQNKGETIHDYYVRTSSNPRNQATVQDGRVVVQNVQGRQNRGQGNNPRGQVQLVMEGFKTELGMQILVKLDKLSVITAMMLLMQAQENGVVLDEEQLLFLASADECDAFDSNVYEAPTTQTMFMANLSSADPVYDEADPSDNLDILSK
ncbi:hypothetical protein Tco_1304926, partial [Tanacetum coccineum]